MTVEQRFDICGEPLRTRWHDRYNCAPWWMFWDTTSGRWGGGIMAVVIALVTGVLTWLVK